MVLLGIGLLIWEKNLNNQETLDLALLAHYAFTIATSWASVERLFSVLKRSFGKHQKSSLQDYIMLSCMRQYNRDPDNMDEDVEIYSADAIDESNNDASSDASSDAVSDSD